MRFDLNEVSSFSEEQLKKLMEKIENNPLIIVPHYLMKSEILENLPIEYKRNETIKKIFDENNEDEYLEIREVIKENLYQRVQDAININLQEWIGDFDD
jgi:predicted regulator of amino acid metabolism with ACT domain